MPVPEQIGTGAGGVFAQPMVTRSEQTPATPAGEDRAAHERLTLQPPGLLCRIPAADLLDIQRQQPHPLTEHQGEAQIKVQIQRVAIHPLARALGRYT